MCPLIQVTGDRVKERRATRGLAAAARMQGQLRQAVKHLERVLEVRATRGCLLVLLSTAESPCACLSAGDELACCPAIQPSLYRCLAAAHPCAALLHHPPQISRDIREHVGDADAYGTIAGVAWAWGKRWSPLRGAWLLHCTCGSRR